MRKLLLILFGICSIATTALAGDWLAQQKQHDHERAAYCAERGYEFNAEYTSAWSMDQKVKDIERSRYWKERGYNFDPEYMTAWSMDQKVKDIERAKYWKAKGYDFDPNYMSAWSMDQAARQKTTKPTSENQTTSGSSPSYPPAVAENGDIRGADNDGDGRLEPVHVRGYYRKDGTYVRGHYRARPRR